MIRNTIARPLHLRASEPNKGPFVIAIPAASCSSPRGTFTKKRHAVL
jgi:hypothetical protein